MAWRQPAAFAAGIAGGWFAATGLSCTYAEESAKRAGVPADTFCADTLSLVELRDIQRGFARDRNWDQFHTPRNFVLAMVGEVGELCECFQWKGEVEPGLPTFSAREKEHIGACV